MSNEDFEARLQLILDTLPEVHIEGTERKHALTKHDMRLIIDVNKVVAMNQPCSLKITNDQATAIVRMVDERRRVVALLGAVLVGMLVFLGEKFLELLSPSFWRHLGELFHN